MKPIDTSRSTEPSVTGIFFIKASLSLWWMCHQEFLVMTCLLEFLLFTEPSPKVIWRACTTCCHLLLNSQPGVEEHILDENRATNIFAVMWTLPMKQGLTLRTIPHWIDFGNVDCAWHKRWINQGCCCLCSSPHTIESGSLLEDANSQTERRAQIPDQESEWRHSP